MWAPAGVGGRGRDGPIPRSPWLLPPPGKEVGETLLYYGCRRSDEDYLYREELAQFHKEGSLTQLNVAFSREQPQKVRKGQAAAAGVGDGRETGLLMGTTLCPQVYVQHLLKRDKEHLWKLIHEESAHIYVCG